MVLKAGRIAYSKNKNAQAFYTDLQKIKSKLMATKKTSIFADERCMREKILSFTETSARWQQQQTALNWKL